jgi:hypothetical protein
MSKIKREPRISPEVLKRYISAFVTSSEPHGIQELNDSNWATINYKASNKRISDHLNGEFFVSIPKQYVKGVVFDLDAHTPETEKNLDERTDAILGIFELWSGLVFSTPRGRHIWFLRERGIIAEGRLERYIETTLNDSGFWAEYGDIEFAPQRAGLMRLPLGHNCFMLDHFSFDPVAPTSIGCLIKLDYILKNKNLDWVYIPDGFDHFKPIKRVGRKRKRRLDVNNGFNQDIQSLLVSGLTENGQRNRVLMKLSWHFQKIEGLDRVGAKRALKEWIDTKHNGLSDDYNRSPKDVYKQIDRIVESFDENIGLAYQKSELTVRPHDITLPSHIVGQTIEEDQEFLKELIAYSKNRGEPKRKWVHVEIPSQTLASWHRSYKRILGKLRKLKLVKDGKNYSTYGKCKTYHVSKSLLVETSLK